MSERPSSSAAATRAELARIIADAADAWLTDGGTMGGPEDRAADAVIAAGWTPPPERADEPEP